MPIRENIQLMHEMIDKMDYMVRVMDNEHKVIYMNEKMRKEYPSIMGDYCYELLGLNNRCVHCVSDDALETGKTDAKDVAIGDRYFRVISSPVDMENGGKYAIELFQDITKQKITENELFKHYKKLKEDIEFAKGVQKEALPLNGNYWDLIDITYSYLPSEDLGGDFFDVIRIDKNKLLIYIADVAGHGVRSSLLTIYLRELIRGKVSGPEIELKELLDHLIKSYNDMSFSDEQYFSLLLCLYDKDKREIKTINAGHNCYPVIIGKDGQVKEIEVKGMPVCNIIKEVHHEEAVAKVEEGDRVLLYTDGVTESCRVRSEGPLGADGVVEIIKEDTDLEGKEFLEGIIEGITSCSGTSPIDDITLVLAKIL